MLLTKDEALNSLEQAITDALDSGITADDIGLMATAQEIRNLSPIELGESPENGHLPIYPIVPSGMVDLAAAKRKYGVNPNTAKGWIARGKLKVMGRIRGRGGTRALVSEAEIAELAKMPKNRGGRPRKT